MRNKSHSISLFYGIDSDRNSTKKGKEVKRIRKSNKNQMTTLEKYADEWKNKNKNVKKKRNKKT